MEWIPIAIALAAVCLPLVGALIGMYYKQQGLRRDVDGNRTSYKEAAKELRQELRQEYHEVRQELHELENEWKERWSNHMVMNNDVLDRLARIETKQDILLKNGIHRD